jgi:hypothetical protein
MLLVVASLFGCTYANSVSPTAEDIRDSDLAAKMSSGAGSQVANPSAEPTENTLEDTENENRNTVEGLVENFGSKLQLVSLLSPDAESSMEKNYGGLVAPDLLDKWRKDPENAPGRLVSSPWPDHIEIRNISGNSDGSYLADGVIVEVTSADTETGGAAAKREITLNVANIGGKWLIDVVTLGNYETDETITYENDQYGFDFQLPVSWKGYTLVTENWNGSEVASGDLKETGPILSIRHPEWKQDDQRQDIPIMIFTLSQWDAVQTEKLSVSAAPFPPSELGRNSTYVFALPARYNYAFPTGYEEVEDILSGKPLTPTENINSHSK